MKINTKSIITVFVLFIILISTAMLSSVWAETYYINATEGNDILGDWVTEARDCHVEIDVRT